MVWSPRGQLIAPPGADGARIYNGALVPGQAPPSTVGRADDYYLDTAANVLWGPKVGPDWITAVQISMVGPPGASGTPGTPGAAGPTGAPGDPYSQVFVGPDSAPPDPALNRLWVDTTISPVQVFNGRYPGAFSNTHRDLPVVPVGVKVLINVVFSLSNPGTGGNIYIGDGNVDIWQLPGYGGHDVEWICYTRVHTFANTARIKSDSTNLTLNFVTVNGVVLG